LLATIVFLIVSYHGAVWLWVSTLPEEVTVPKVVGLAEQEADKVLEAAGLRVQVEANKPDEEVPEDAVLSADPPPERRVKKGRLVRLTLSSGSRWSVVPDVREMSVDRARALLHKAKLSVGSELARYHEKVPIGYVIGHAPKPGQEVPRGADVELWVSKGPQPSPGPDELGEQEDTTRQTEMDYIVPPGANIQEVRIVVRDQRGERTVYRAFHQPGDRVSQLVSGQGPDVVVQLYLSGLLVQERRP
jgi:serine/threonine-protein kinase